MKSRCLVKMLIAIAVCAGVLTVAPGAGAAPHAPYVSVQYGTDNYQTLHAYTAPSPGSPLVVLVHGGGWKAKIDNFLPDQAAQLQESGYSVFDVNYDTYSRTTGAFPLEADDVESAIQWAINNASTYNADPANVELIGGSAGGQLVSMAAEQLNAANPGTVSSVVTLSGLFDFNLLLADLANGASISPYIRSSAEEALACVHPKDPCSASLASTWSPDQRVTPTTCGASWLIFNGTSELMPSDQADAMTNALQTNGCSVTENVFQDGEHAFAYWSTVVGQIQAFLNDH